MTAAAYSVLAFSGAQWVLLIVFIIPVVIEEKWSSAGLR